MDSAWGCLVIATYNLELFGENLRKIREACQLTQASVSVLCGVNRDTLRRIEQGLVIPKCETLELLSEVYKTDLLQELILCRMEIEISSYFRKIDDFLIDFELAGLDNLKHTYDLFLEYQAKKIFNSTASEQLSQVLTFMIDHFDTGLDQALPGFIRVLKISQPTFERCQYKTLKFSTFEYRLLILIATSLSENRLYGESSELLDYILKQCQLKRNSRDNSVQLAIRTMTGLARNAFEMSEYDKALTYINQGIDLTIAHQTLYGLGCLYFQRGRVKWVLQLPDAVLDCKKGIQLMEIQGKEEIAHKYHAHLINTML